MNIANIKPRRISRRKLWIMLTQLTYTLNKKNKKQKLNYTNNFHAIFFSYQFA